MGTKNIFTKYLLCFLFALLLASGISAYGAGLGGVRVNQPGLLPAPDPNEGLGTAEVQAMKEGYEFVEEEVLFGDTGKPGLGGVRVNQPNLLPAPDPNEGLTTAEVQAMKEGYEFVEEEVLFGDTGKPGLGGVKVDQPYLLPAPAPNEGTGTHRE